MHKHISGVFAGINYIGIMRVGKSLVNIFQKGADNPLATIFPTLNFDSVPVFMEKIKALGGDVLIPMGMCPYTRSPVAVCGCQRQPVQIIELRSA